MVRPAGPGLLGVLVLLAACGDSGVTASPDGGSDAGPALAGRTFVSTGDAGIPGGGPLRLSFTDDGRLQATAGCNSLNGPVQLSGGQLVGTDLAMTEMGCEPDVMESDAWLADLVAAEPAWELTEDDTVVLTAGDLVVTLVDRDVLEPPAELTGQEWDVDTLIDGETASTVPAGVDAYLELDTSTLSGVSGCNEVSGTVAVSGDTITFTELGGTDMLCEEAAMGVEELVLSVLAGEVRYSIDGDRLTLENDTGQGLQAVAGG
ncbi:META domain-containing protein [Jiangella asiatica]|uniref:META domain-containing protein n=1 Tax=Jiangella asiatica TaxID=2530372 RepID=A0A4R5CML7_9ACTN|nr:META domain-containing protein [Jiangella asiatica]TDE01622.1 META domain-containing protein [Jiangella asiatica]